MHSIISGGELVAICDKPRYVKMNESSGAYIESDRDGADGVAVCGRLYSLMGKKAIPGAPEAAVVESDAGEFLFQNMKRIEKNKAEAGAAAVRAEEALCDVDVGLERKIAILEEALCELDGALSERGRRE